MADGEKDASTPADAWHALVAGLGEAGERLARRTEALSREEQADGFRALEGLDGARVVMGLGFHDDRQPVAEVHRARVFSRALQHARSSGRQPTQRRARALIGAVLAPHGADDAELDLVGVAAERGIQPLVLGGAEANLGEEAGSDWRLRRV